MNTQKLLLAIGLTAAVSLSCGSGGDELAEASPPLPVNPSAMAAGDFESTLLADGDLTFDEYETAFLTYVGCAKLHGWQTAEEPRLTSRQNYEFQLMLPNAAGLASGGLDSARQALESCRTENFDEVQRVWSLKTALSGSERQAARDDLGACLRSAGFDLPEHPSSEDWRPFIVVSSGLDLSARETWRGCKAQVQEKYGLLSSEVP